MPAPVAVCVVAAIAGVAAVIAFHEFVFEPHIAPAIERWAEDFLAKRRARRRGPVPSASTRGSGDGHPGPSGADPRKRTPAGDEDSIELQGLDLNAWLNQVHRTAPHTSMRRRATVIHDTDEGSISTTIDSFTSLTHTPLAPTHVISNVSSPFTETLSMSARTPARAHSRASSRTARDGEREVNTTLFNAPSSPSSSAPPSPPFGPILPDTPRTSAAYSARPFSPVVRTPVRSRVPSSRSSLQHSSSRICVDVQGRRVDIDVVGEHLNSSVNTSMHEDMSANTSVVDSLSERYPAASAPPVLLSPPPSDTVFSSPSTDVLSLGSSGSCPGSPFDLVSPPVRIGEVHLSPPEQHASLSGAASSLSPLMMSEHEFVSFGEASNAVGEEILASRSGSARLHNPFSDFDEGNDSDSDSEGSGSDGSWGRVRVGRS
ncbi:hypothetical protein DEU56DRAFT_354549 [Suillus clintonianus]|uniref:uncharacterized protein n=1 Tax=Suillus clintonianus TaxID=1904413 RepID=UPI001B86232D|nr:uncharacterized protein DEU56DRAFT_354549 [Suillus clintonianus]KAG2137058.1 hypothetical protein DEU56DRAFT_354549 [Suillus clintonianus]